MKAYSDIIQRLESLKIVPVVTIEDARHALPLAEALLAGGLPCIEITFRTAAAGEALREISSLSSLLVGAGTVLTVDQAREAADAGARFLVSPGVNPRVVEHCLEEGIPLFPGTATPTDIDAALAFGIEVVKFFPAEAFGGVKALKAISAPYTRVKFIPTGGINAENLSDYLSLPSVLACGGSWMAKKDWIAKEKFDEITRRTRDALSAIPKSD